MDRSEKQKNEASIFRAFWVALSHTDPISRFRYRRWIHQGDNDAPDFLCKDAQVGMELAEWLDRRQTKIARERDRLEADLKNFIQRKRLPYFQPGGRSGITLVLEIRDDIPRHARSKIIGELLNFAVSEVRRNESALPQLGSLYVPNLPVEVARYFCDLQLFRLEGPNIGVSVQTGGAYDPNKALDSLEDVLKDKIVNKASRYAKARSRHGLTRLSLVVYYDRALMWNAPFHGLGLSFTYGDDETEVVVAEAAKHFVHKFGNGQFDDVFLLFAPLPDPTVHRLWPIKEHRGTRRPGM